MRKLQYNVNGTITTDYNAVKDIPHTVELVDYNPDAEAEAEASRIHREKFWKKWHENRK